MREAFDIPKFEDDDKPVDIKYYLIKYFRFWPIYLMSIIVALAGMFMYHRYTVEQYEVKGSMLINAAPSPEVRILDRSNIFENPGTLENDMLVFTSKNLAAKALEKVHFDVSYFACTTIKEIELYQKSPIMVEVDWDHVQQEHGLINLTVVGEEEFTLSIADQGLFNHFSTKTSIPKDADILGKTYRFGEVIESSRTKFVVKKEKSMEVGEKLSFIIHNPSSLADYYSNAISVRPQNNYGSVLQVTLRTKVVEKGRDYVNALMNAYMEHDLEKKNQIAENTLQFIEDQMYVVEDSLKLAERRMLDFKVDNKMLDVDSEYGGVLTKIQALEERHQEMDFELEYYKSLETYLSEKKGDYSETVAPSMMGITDASLNNMTQQLMTLSMERKSMLSVVNENHPDVKKLDEQVGRLRENIFENIKNLVANTEKKQQEAEKKLAAYDREFSKLPKAESNYANIFREFKLRENLYNYLLEKQAEVGIAKASNVSDISVVDYAKRGSLIFPKKLNNYGMALVLGLVLPLGFILLYDFVNDKILDQIQLKNAIRMPLLGTIGYSDKKTNMLVAEHPKSIASESFRSLRSALFYIASDKKCKRILVTSSVSGEGKTFVSLNLAAAMALSGKKTCVLGMDLRKPRIAQYVGISNKSGLSSYLVGRSSKAEIVHQTEHENLYFIPSGPVPPNPSELLLKPQLRELMASLEKEFEVVILDTPPLALVSETKDLLRFSDVNLYIVRQDYTRKKYLLMINDLYDNDQVDNFYGVFNAVKASGNDFGGYNYGYGYNYSFIKKGYYSGYYEEEPASVPKGWFARMLDRFRG
ncbi:polysaccharide biosynthesis tyrosine autokinase [Echinicola soli]|uniref:non-specific protein-tyrosine kinase n=1 Tax=Echinicola soli TaxID=2591634 RepID=A0A514CID2_9BACT|nr:polysaccharide biosynthesis tyrosine autokinase [Echinicola soli]QDH79540.1 polysaccharide biosynthesis tyrosine autokinase [Echinicola soli]